jgi:sulfite reductase alpha subunit-like flavoprotein
MEKLGAERILEMGVANAEHHTTEDDFENWRNKFWPTITEHFASNQTELEKEVSIKRQQSRELLS